MAACNHLAASGSLESLCSLRQNQSPTTDATCGVAAICFTTIYLSCMASVWYCCANTLLAMAKLARETLPGERDNNHYLPCLLIVVRGELCVLAILIVRSSSSGGGGGDSSLRGRSSWNEWSDIINKWFAPNSDNYSAPEMAQADNLPAGRVVPGQRASLICARGNSCC